MYKALKIFLKVLMWTAAVIVAVLSLTFGLLNTSLNKKIVAKVVPEFMEGNIEYSKLRIHVLPRITLSLDSLVLTGPQQDTIATVDRIRAAVQTLPLLKSRIRVDEATVQSLCANLWKDEEGKANWDIFKSSEKDTTEEEKPYSPLDLKIGHLSIDGIVAYSTPSMAVLAQLDTIAIAGNDRDSYDVVIDTEIDYSTSSLGTINIPFSTRGRLNYALDSATYSIFIDSLDTHLAYIPLMFDGTVISREEGYDIDLYAGVNQCQLKPVIDKYLAVSAPDIARKISAGTISLDAKVKGLYSDSTMPDVDAALKAKMLGADIRFNGRAVNLSSKKPKLEAHATVKATLDSFMRFVPDTSELNISGNLKVKLDKPFTSDQRFALSADFDTLALRSGKTLAANLKKMHNTVTVTYEKNHFGKWVPKLEVKTTNERVKVLMDGNRLNFRDLAMAASIRKIKIDSAAVAKRFAAMPKRPRRDTVPEYLKDKDFEKSDIAFSVDSSISRFFSQWSPAGSVHLGRGSVVSPQFPLRVRITGVDAKFDSNKLDIDYIGVKTGRSDVSLAGDLSGYRSAPHGRKGHYRVNLDVYSKKCNVNELLAAVEKGSQSKFVETGDVHDESFAIDTLTDAQIEEPPLPLIVIPSNLRANININADSLYLYGLDINPLEATFIVRERTAQLLSSRVATSFGVLNMDAYYASRTKEDISAGFHVDASDIMASGIINLVPAVDSLMPMLRSLEGRMKATLTATTQLDTNMNIIIPSLNAMFKIYGNELNISDAGDLRKVTRLLMFRNPNIGKISDMSVGGVVRDSKLEIYPFVIGLDRYRIALSGTQEFDGRFNYHASILKSPILIRFGIDINGNADNWKWKLCRARYKSSYAPVYSQRIDTMQFNLAQSIRGVFTHGAENVRKTLLTQSNSIATDYKVDSLKMAADSTSTDSISDEALATSFTESSQKRISALKEKIEQRAITRRSEVIRKKEEK